MQLAVIAMPFFLTGCAAVYYPDPTAALVDQGRGTYHTVAKGETLWAISQAYRVDIDELILLNSIADAQMIRRGQKIFIPGAPIAQRRDVARVETSARYQEIKAETSRRQVSTQDLRQTEFAWPYRGTILSMFHSREAGFWDQGIRIRTAPGVQISATRQGKVVFVDDLTGYGQTVIVDHMDGFMSVYAGNVQPVVRLSDTVSKGEAVAVSPSGESGFLYFEVRRHGAAANPMFYLPKS